MNNKKIKKILSIALLSTVIVGNMPYQANAAWINNSDNSWKWIENGTQSIGWKYIDATWYYFGSEGNMKTGWIKDNNVWYYLESSGAMKTGWVFDAGNWYYLSNNGAMKTGWINDNSVWYFADDSGAMQTGIIEVDGKIYALNNSGAMNTSFVNIGNVNYTIDVSGALIGDNLPNPIKRFLNTGALVNQLTTDAESKVESTETEEKKSSSSSSSSNSTNNIISVAEGEDLVIDKKGTYGSSSKQTVITSACINSPDVVLKNVHITGDLELAEGIGDGDVTLENVTVDGDTIVKAGGENSIHFKDTTLATVIVNKNDGKVRIVVEGNSNVAEVQLESTAKLEENNLEGNAEGFTDVNVTESVQCNGDLKVELVGSFETINSRAHQVKIQLDESTDIESLVLSVAAMVFGDGKINVAIVNADGSSISTRPNNVVLNANSVSLRDEVITESYSDAATSEILGIKADMSSIAINMNDFIAGITINDFKITAILDGQEIELEDLMYDANNKRIYFNPVNLADNIGKTLNIKVEPNSEKLTGTSKTSEVIIKHGFSGKITDIHGVGISNLTIKFTKENTSDEERVEVTAVTDKDGYYSVEAQPGHYIGKITGNGIIETSMYASSLTNRFNIEQNETAIRATSMDAVKIVLSWGEYPRDEDSHLQGPTLEGDTFHTWYGDRIYTGNDDVRYADLDWDDTNSYGPETTTIYKLIDGTYKFYVHNFSGESPLVDSDAKVQIYKGNSSTPEKEIKIKNDDSKSGQYWDVFEMTVSNNGQNVEIKEINTVRDMDELDYSELFNVMNSVYSGNYTEESWDLYVDTVDNIMDEIFTQEDIYRAIELVRQAQNLLVEKNFDIDDNITTSAAVTFSMNEYISLLEEDEEDTSNDTTKPLSDKYRENIFKKDIIKEKNYDDYE